MIKKALSFYISLSIVLISGSLCQAQTVPDVDWALGARTYYGFIMPHHQNMLHLVKGHIGGFEIRWEKQSKGEHPLNSKYAFPRWGFSYQYYDLANPLVLGNGHTLMADILLPLREQKKLSPFLRLSSGVGYLEKKFDIKENHKNIAIGSHINGTVNLGFELKYKLSKHLELGGSVNLAHFSNGSGKTPNLGINLPNTGIGLHYLSLIPEGKVNSFDTTIVTHGKNSLTLALAYKEKYPVGGNQYFNSSLAFARRLQVSRKSRLGLGAELFYDASIHDVLVSDSITNPGVLKSFKPAIYATHLLDISRISIIMESGVYLYTADERRGRYYQRIGFQYQQKSNYFFTNLFNGFYLTQLF